MMKSRNRTLQSILCVRMYKLNVEKIYRVPGNFFFAVRLPIELSESFLMVRFSNVIWDRL